MMKLALVLLGGAIGTGCRFGLATWMNGALGPRTFPYATFLINLTGSFLIGLLAELFDTKTPVSPEIRAALIIGFLGGYTTFSSFSLETLTLLRSGLWLQAAIYPIGSLLLGLLAVWSGMQAARFV
jgi:fluoride exporter